MTSNGRISQLRRLGQSVLSEQQTPSGADAAAARPLPAPVRPAAASEEDLLAEAHYAFFSADRILERLRRRVQDAADIGDYLAATGPEWLALFDADALVIECDGRHTTIGIGPEGACVRALLQRIAARLAALYARPAESLTGALNASEAGSAGFTGMLALALPHGSGRVVALRRPSPLGQACQRRDGAGLKFECEAWTPTRIQIAKAALRALAEALAVLAPGEACPA